MIFFICLFVVFDDLIVQTNNPSVKFFSIKTGNRRIVQTNNPFYAFYAGKFDRQTIKSLKTTNTQMKKIITHNSSVVRFFILDELSDGQQIRCF